MTENSHQKIQAALDGHSLGKLLPERNPIEQLNEKILAITLRIQNKFPELAKYLEELPVTIPDEKNPVIDVVSLQQYYESLETLVNKYVLEHPENQSKKN